MDDFQLLEDSIGLPFTSHFILPATPESTKHQLDRTGLERLPPPDIITRQRSARAQAVFQIILYLTATLKNPPVHDVRHDEDRNLHIVRPIAGPKTIDPNEVIRHLVGVFTVNNDQDAAGLVEAQRARSFSKTPEAGR
ncbi:hypothetical protein PGTUg99_016459 [Puccinia graminis f. sp. tritici]|uniref:Uncharacterized protein n=1 Tax=Puccinia graminis f. sp. tritici TaxID=56615 RepID=A0A5B0LKD4_PUCGR|nr:hypothetical protein PGTUg99_016459 [Puccinia graminis f. sp. tritici]